VAPFIDESLSLYLNLELYRRWAKRGIIKASLNGHETILYTDSRGNDAPYTWQRCAAYAIRVSILYDILLTMYSCGLTAPNRSFFLVGLGGTGKSTWLDQHFSMRRYALTCLRNQHISSTLIDTLIRFWLAGWQPRIKVRETLSPKFFLFDTGVVSFLKYCI
jgi:hypothetical protein